MKKNLKQSLCIAVEKISFYGLLFLFLTACTQQENAVSKEIIPNLSVEIVTQNYQRDVLPFIQFDELALTCNSIPITDDDDGHIIGEELPTFPESWCGIKAINIPLKTDSNGIAKAFFYIEPDPLTVELIHNFNATGPSPYQVPLMFSQIGLETREGNLSVKSNNEWVYTAHFDIPKN